MKRLLDTFYRLTNYNIKIIFGNKFVYFVISAVILYIVTVLIHLISDIEFLESTAYNILLVPSVLIIFYPMCFGIQNDQDAKIIEIIFGIPNYRYKVWLFRLLIAYLICFAITCLLVFLTDWLLVDVSILELTLQILVPALFIGSLSFMLSTIIKNGNGTAVVVMIVCLLFFILEENAGLSTSKWNLFFNPFELPLDTNPSIHYSTLIDNRVILAIASILFLLVGLYKTQEREKFI
ncbi:hypothetical protein LJC62_04780 [Odoribacter sp. OttesenSCG-928-A06]|nr:hypothetical protein [Odoribacter sp. OttesenSCG-928-A06]